MDFIGDFDLTQVFIHDTEPEIPEEGTLITSMSLDTEDAAVNHFLVEDTGKRVRRTIAEIPEDKRFIEIVGSGDIYDNILSSLRFFRDIKDDPRSITDEDNEKLRAKALSYRTYSSGFKARYNSHIPKIIVVNDPDNFIKVVEKELKVDRASIQPIDFNNRFAAIIFYGKQPIKSFPLRVQGVSRLDDKILISTSFPQDNDIVDVSKEFSPYVIVTVDFDSSSVDTDVDILLMDSFGVPKANTAFNKKDRLD